MLVVAGMAVILDVDVDLLMASTCDDALAVGQVASRYIPRRLHR